MRRWADETAATMRRGSTAAAVVAVVVLAAAAAFGFVQLRHRAPAAEVDPHGVVLAPSRLDAIVRAAAAVSAATPAAELAAEGKKLFESTAVARPGESCQTCHPGGGATPEIGTIVHPRKAGDFTGPRDPPSLWGVASTAPYLWSGSVPTLEQQVTNVIAGFFKPQPAEVVPRQTAALVAYLKTLNPPQTAFDSGTLSPAALRGQKVFNGKGGCIECHGGPLFTDNLVHNTFVPQAPGANDPGSPTQPGAFNTPQLRDVAHTAPYMHNGVLATLRDVVVFYDQRSSIAPLNLSAQEIDDLVEYQRSL